jgi:hypothetical protein
MEYPINIAGKTIILEYDDIDEIINVDDFTRINTGNLFGETVTVSAAANRIGLMKSEIEGDIADLKLDLKMFENDYRNRLRVEASNNSGTYTIKVGKEEAKVKLTEKSLETCYESDPEWIEINRKINKATRIFGQLTSLHWSIQDKCRKLNGLVTPTTPEEFAAEMVEGKVNGFLLSKNSFKAGSIK